MSKDKQLLLFLRNINWKTIRAEMKKVNKLLQTIEMDNIIEPHFNILCDTA